MFFLKLLWRMTKKLLANGLLVLVVSTMLLVSEELLPVVVPICLLLTILILNRT